MELDDKECCEAVFKDDRQNTLELWVYDSQTLMFRIFFGNEQYGEIRVGDKEDIDKLIDELKSIKNVLN